jgi:spore coat polysaccharide biosynthesis protein SpsF
MKPAILVYARMDSRRLPGKAMRLLCGRPMVSWVMERSRRASVGEVILATSDRAVDDPLAQLAAREGWPCFRGAAEDVVGRSIACANARGLDAIVRITGDSPMIDPEHIAALAKVFADNSPDLATNTFPRTFPPGCSIEILSYECLARVARDAADPQDREHLTRYVYRHPDDFRILNVERTPAYAGDLNLSVDTPADLELADWIMGHAADPGNLPLEETMALAAKFKASGTRPGADRNHGAMTQ